MSSAVIEVGAIRVDDVANTTDEATVASCGWFFFFLLGFSESLASLSLREGFNFERNDDTGDIMIRILIIGPTKIRFHPKLDWGFLCTIGLNHWS